MRIFLTIILSVFLVTGVYAQTVRSEKPNEQRHAVRQHRQDARQENRHERQETKQERRDTRQEDRKKNRQERREARPDKGDRKILGNSDGIFPKSKTNRPINSTFKKNNFGADGAFGHNKELDSHETFGGTNSQFATKRKPVDETTFPPEIKDALAARKRH